MTNEAMQTNTYKMTTEAFKTLVKRIMPSVCKDPTRFHLNGALFADGKVISTDGHRLTVLETEFATVSAMIVPMRGLEMALLACEDNQSAAITFDGRTFAVAAGSSTISVKAVDAQFPPYERVIPTHAHTTVKVSRDALRKVVRKAAVGRDGQIVLEVGPAEFEDREIRVVDGVERDEGQNNPTSVAVKSTCEGKAVRIAVSKTYLDEALIAAPKGDITLEFGQELDPIKLTAADITVVIMPMRF